MIPSVIGQLRDVNPAVRDAAVSTLIHLRTPLAAGGHLPALGAMAWGHEHGEAPQPTPF